MKVISLGWGVQSFTLAAMVALGELEPVDAAIHADTTYEMSWTYQFIERWRGWLKDHGLNLVTVRASTKPDPMDVRGGIGIPAFADTERGGQIRRQCTYEWKTRPMRKWLQDNRNGEHIEMWLGISLDEFQRMKDADVQYITHRWPLIEKRMTRLDCVKWLEKHHLEVPQKSACTFCPFHSSREWHDIQANGNGDWGQALWADYTIRKARPPYDLYLHPSRKPLHEVDFRTMEEKGQLSLWDNECSGVCGI